MRKTTIKHDDETDKNGNYKLSCLSKIVRELDERISELENEKNN